MNGPLLAVSHLRKNYQGVTAVNDVSFSLARGELLALIGPNGAGKSTCFNMLSGQVGPDAGTIFIDGVETTNLSAAKIFKLGVGRTFQIAETYLSMTVRENVQVALLSHAGKLSGIAGFLGGVQSKHRDEADSLLSLIGMENNADRSCSALSYGDVKRLELAIALAGRPKLLLMDEPAAGMAPRERIELMQLTAHIVRERQIGALFTEHDMDIVFEHASRLIVLNRGSIVAEGSPDSVRANSDVQEIYLGSGLLYHSKASS